MKTKFYMSVAVSVILLLSLAGCGKTKEPVEVKPDTEKEVQETENAGDVVAETAKTGEIENANPEESVAPEAEPDEKDETWQLYAELADWDFAFASGAGGWQTSLTVEKDGSFAGEYFDGDMGDTGPGYEENGTFYQCVFHGKLEGCTKISDFIYEIRIASIQYEKEPDTEEIKDGTRYVYSLPYGLEGTDCLTVYLPGTPYDTLAEPYKEWVKYTHFGNYTPDEYYMDEPAELPFCGLYNAAGEYGFFSENRSDRNKLYLINQAKLPGLVSEKAEQSPDGTYFYQDAEAGWTYWVTNQCFKLPNGIDMFSDHESFAKECIKRANDGREAKDLYLYDRDSAGEMSGMVKQLFVNGNECLYAIWTEGSEEDTIYCAARMFQVFNYAYVYVISYDPDIQIINGELADFYLASLSISGSPRGLSSAGEEGAESLIYANVTDSPFAGSLLADEVFWLSYGDEELLREYGIDPDEITNDYAIAGGDGIYDEYKLADDCAIYIQYPENPFHSLVSRDEFSDYLGRSDVGRLMRFVLDKDHKVTMVYEPYTP